MAINLTVISGTDSLASNRITINDNFRTLSNSFNKILNVIDSSTGKIDNSGSMLPSITSGNLTLQGPIGIKVYLGDLNLYTGSIKIGDAGFIEFGSGSGVNIRKSIKTAISESYNLPVFDYSGAIGSTAEGNVGYVTLPKKNRDLILDDSGTSVLNDPEYGSIFYDTVSGLHYVYLGNNTTDGFESYYSSSTFGPGSGSNTNTINPDNATIYGMTNNGENGCWVPLATQEWVYNQVYAILGESGVLEIPGVSGNPNIP